MERKEELYSQSINAGKRKYFIDVKETKGGDKFITLAESRKLFDSNTGNFHYEKNKMFLYKEDFEKFQKGLSNALRFIETGEMPAVDVNTEFGCNYPENEGRKSDFDLSGSSALDNIDLNF